MQGDLHLIYKQIPVIWIKAGKPTSDTQKAGRGDDGRTDTQTDTTIKNSTGP